MVPLKKPASPSKKNKRCNKTKGKSMTKKKSTSICLSAKQTIKTRKIQLPPKVGSISWSDAKRAARIVLGKSKKK